MRNPLIPLLIALAALGTAYGQGLTVWTTFSDATLEWFQNEAAGFEASFGVPVEIVKVDIGEWKQQLLLAAPQGEGADLVVGVPHDQIGEVATGGVIADMGSFATRAYLDDLSEQARLAYTLDGKLFGLPMFVEGPALIVNRELVAETPATYEALVERARELTTAETFGFLFDINNFYFAYGWLHTPGGYVFARDDRGDLVPSDLGLANEGAVAGARMLRALRHEHGLIPAGTDYNVANGLFTDGVLGMIYTGPWAIPGYRDAGLDVTVVPMPPLADGTPWSGFMGVQGVVMNQFSEAKIDAANLAKWLVRPDAQVSMARLSGRIPASDSAVAQVSDDEIIAGFGRALQNSEPMPNIPEMGAVWGPMGNALSVITESADSDVEAVLEQAVREIGGN